MSPSRPRARRDTLWSLVDARMERLVMRPPTGEAARLWLIGVGLLLALATAARALVGPYPMVNLFILPVLASCVVFRRRGLKVLVPALICYHLTGIARGGQPTGLLWASDLTQLLEWTLVSAFALVTLDRLAAVKGLQQRLNQDLEMARTLQSALIPSDYEFGRLRILGMIRQTHNVGGDFYYFRPFMQKYAVFCLGDVMGKGISASLLMALVMGFMFEWGKQSPSPAFILKKLNHRLLKLWAGTELHPFITMIYGVFNEESGVLTYSGAGHQNGILLRASGGLEMIRTEGLPLGVLEESEFSEAEVSLAVGDRVLFFTDGITEARSPQGELFGLERLLDLLGSMRQAPLKNLLIGLEQAVDAHTEGHHTDDLALLVAQVRQ